VLQDVLQFGHFLLQESEQPVVECRSGSGSGFGIGRGNGPGVRNLRIAELCLVVKMIYRM
jgi:hypothetical protein